MVSLDENEALLKSLGLTDYEVKAFMTLLKRGDLTAEKLSEIASIPLPRVYDTVTELERKGFVIISKTRPKIFKPNAPKNAIENLLSMKKMNMEKEMGEMKKRSKVILDNLSKIKKKKNNGERKWSLWTSDIRSNIISIIEEGYGLAEKEILIFSGEIPEKESIFRLLGNGIKNNIKIRAVVNSTSKDTIKKLRDLGIETKTGFSGEIFGTIIDDKIGSLVIQKSNGKKSKEFELLAFDNPNLVKFYKDAFNFIWSKL